MDVRLWPTNMYKIGKYVLMRNTQENLNANVVLLCSKGILIEAIVTFVLVTVILMVALDTKSKTGLAPLLIGFALAVNILAM